MLRNAEQLARDFASMRLEGSKLDANDIKVEQMRAPHRRPSKLPTGRMAVIVFSRGGEALLVGKCGANSEPRYAVQHYLPNSNFSTFAGSLLKNADEFGLHSVGQDGIRDWIEANTARTNFLLRASLGDGVLSAFKNFLVERLDPRFGSGRR